MGVVGSGGVKAAVCSGARFGFPFPGLDGLPDSLDGPLPRTGSALAICTFSRGSGLDSTGWKSGLPEGAVEDIESSFVDRPLFPGCENDLEGIFSSTGEAANWSCGLPLDFGPPLSGFPLGFMGEESGRFAGGASIMGLPLGVSNWAEVGCLPWRGPPCGP